MGVCTEERNKKRNINEPAPMPITNRSSSSKRIPPKFNDINSKSNNVIKMKLEVKEKDVNKQTKILYNIDKTGYGCDLKQLNESNTKLFINGKLCKYKSYFIPKEKGIYEIKIIIKILMENCCCLFYGLSNLQSIDLSSFNTQNVTNMSYMFQNCNNLINLDLSSFNTKNVTDMYYMFYGCKNLNNINLSSFNIQKVIYMHNMFNGCESLKNLDLSSFNTPNLESMYGMFQNCLNLETLDLSSFNTKKNQFDFNNMFTKCTKLQRVVLSSNADDLNEIIKNDLGSYFKNDIITYA